MFDGLDAFSLATAALMAGLWWGERGRRRDAQRREGVIEVDPVEPAEVRPPGGLMPGDVERELEASEAWIEECMTETGCSRQEAIDEWHRCLNQAHTEQPTGLGPA